MDRQKLRHISKMITLTLCLLEPHQLLPKISDKFFETPQTMFTCIVIGYAMFLTSKFWL